MTLYDQTFLNQSLSRQIIRVAPPKYGYLLTVSTLTNKKGPDSMPGLDLDLNPQRIPAASLF
jgi:hypothetical protein